MEHLLYLFNRGESATVMNEPVARIPSADVSELSDELAREIYIAVAKLNGDVVDPTTVASWTVEYAAQEMFGVYSYLFDAVAVVPADQENAIREFGNKMLDRMENGDDSDCYEAAADFGDYLHSICIVELDFPDGSEE